MTGQIPHNMIQLSIAPVDEDGAPVWNAEIERNTERLGDEFLAPFLVEVSPGMCLGGYVAKAKYHSPVRPYEATAVLLTRANDELRTTVLITAPGCPDSGDQWKPYSHDYSASLPKEHLQNIVHTIRGLCEQSHAQELLKKGNRGIFQTDGALPEEGAGFSPPISEMHGFSVNEFVVYPAHGVGQILAIECQTIAGANLEMFVIHFAQDKMTLRVPAAKVAIVGMRKISAPSTLGLALSSLSEGTNLLPEKAKQYEDKIHSGDIFAIAETVRDLQPSQTLRNLYEAALVRLSQEIAAARGLTEVEAVAEIEKCLSTPA